ncbi:MAG: diacylglycerol O-acyltransferase / wax synthase [Solirubrobacteraceae bacterium]|nr:diacylglycerol O-acyltransferase / wax synthase [Solirubrobacteraceae bacterium]
MPSHRLSPLDGSFLRLDAAGSMMHVGWSAVFAAPGENPRPSVEALRERVAGRLHEVPWCRWRLEPAPLGLTEPRWVEDPDFDVTAHVIELTRPNRRVSSEEFAQLRNDVLSLPLDRSRPLWQVLLVPRLADGRVGMIGKIHHSLVDGVAALRIVGLVLDGEPDAVSQPEVAWAPTDGATGPVAWTIDGVARTATDVVRGVSLSARLAARPRSSLRGALRGIGHVVGAARDDILPAAPDSRLNVRIGPRRAFAGYHSPRAELRAARARGGTPNDIGLAAVSGALRAFAAGHDGPPTAPLKAMVPVSMRRANEVESGNRFAMVYLRLPVHLDGLADRLAWVRAQTEELKYSDRAEGTQLLFAAGGLLPAPLRSPVVSALAAPRVFNLTVSQSPGPRGSLYLLGCELEEPYSVVPVAQGHALAIGMVRYRQELFFGCYGDPDALPDLDRLPGLIGGEMRALGALPGKRAPAPRAVAAG